MATKFERASFPTPSPSPPSRAVVPPTTSTRRNRHEDQLARIAHAAEHARLAHLAKAVHAAAPTASTTGAGVKMLRYSFHVEHDERGHKVLKRVTVIVPEVVGGKAAKGESDDARTALRQRPVSSFLFIPPQQTATAARPRARVAPPARRLSAPRLSNLSLIPPAPPVPQFQSTASSRRSVVPAPSEATIQQRRDAVAEQEPVVDPLCPGHGDGVERVPSGAGLDRVAAWARDQRERVRRKRGGQGVAEPSEEDEATAPARTRAAKRQRRDDSLGERRGKMVEPLRLV
ncbi:hypothetical protein JCM3775_000206 [Rhodotorula graminis]|uniref:Uncharacterized protein n=1 Tax=Rhodotorula graminis (strain WP1) TaxID=578459 RepID=A0A194S7J3_RHOGW|nr:uncharacterized protein RHOBADRAFT_53364 [Rhodotorula graminis WP1]KPV75381.1 hypothetical protein RHOBADRAFT_53364 [Rhodotorula graminis WP1]